MKNFAIFLLFITTAFAFDTSTPEDLLLLLLVGMLVVTPVGAGSLVLVFYLIRHSIQLFRKWRNPGETEETAMNA